MKDFLSPDTLLFLTSSSSPLSQPTQCWLSASSEESNGSSSGHLSAFCKPSFLRQGGHAKDFLNHLNQSSISVSSQSQATQGGVSSSPEQSRGLSTGESFPQTTASVNSGEESSQNPISRSTNKVRDSRTSSGSGNGGQG